MSDSVIPNMKAEDLNEPSPAVKAQRDVVAMAHSAFQAVGQATIRAAEAEKAAELMRYLDNVYKLECDKLDGIIATEALGKPVVVENHSTIRLAPKEAQH